MHSTASPAASLRNLEKLYGRRRGHTLRVRQQLLLDVTLPRLRLNPDALPRWAENWLEIGFGGGEHALALAQSRPDAAVIACEVFANGICSLLSKLVPEGGEAASPLQPNLYLWDQDARPLLRRLPDACLDRLYLMFPDPWPKGRHADRRFVNPANIAQAARLLKPGATWRIASDDPTYQAWVADQMAQQDLFAHVAPSLVRPPGWLPTRYEAKALKAGRQPLYWSFPRRAGP